MSAYEEATKRGVCIVCEGTVVTGESVRYILASPVHEECDKRSHNVLCPHCEVPL